MDKPQLVMLGIMGSCIIVSCGVCAYMLAKLKLLPDELKKMVEEEVAAQLYAREFNKEAKLRCQQRAEYEKQKQRNLGEILKGDPYGYYQPPKSKVWVAEIILPNKDSKAPSYYFHCPAYDSPEKIGGKCYLYTATGRGFVTTDHPTTAILIQQLLNEGQLTVQPFNPETK